jgi:glycine cleavage system transcriptional repressor
MKGYAIVTAVGADRVGIVDDISREILSLACNIEESRMALLGGDFCGFVARFGEGPQWNGSSERLPPSLPSCPDRPGPDHHGPTETVDALPYLLESPPSTRRESFTRSPPYCAARASTSRP